ncbi:nicotinate phosphoribosyltransferase [Soehngenia longivitae]|uniref:Nicotinate phosphoribosyltransferase n=1 Tax=Soehngenia longivitae TaxID=2562294 RepID=A0A4Z0D4L2_9FIRM|nr:nicotinate phosphoribosyltransferase [Soehngenia longivitae]TFZ39212.1 nicotinate phosphoribosyltransferase [Soehngenia longivitae]
MEKVDWLVKENLTMLADFYEFTMANGYLENNMEGKIAYFDMFFRSIPDDGGFAIMAGVEQLLDYLNNLKFSEDDINYFKSTGIFGEKFINYLENFNFTCDVWAIPEGTPIFPNEPIVTVRGPVVQAQLIETMVLLTVNHQSLIATKANRIVRAADGRSVIEFGSRRAQGYGGAILGARAAYIGGCIGTANTIVDRDFNIPALGTMAHSWVQLFPSELEAFKAYARVYPDNCTLLVDTYDTLSQGVPNAIKTFNEEVLPRGFRPKGIRIDSGDIAYLSKEARKMLDEAGFSDVKIMASSSLDEFVIKDLLNQGAKIDMFGVGERLITAQSEPIFGGVYKLVAVEENGEIVPKIKISNNVNKITTPGFKQVYRFYDKRNNKAMADVITLYDEKIPEKGPYEIFHPLFTWKRKLLNNYYVRPLLVQIYDKGKCVYQSPNIHEIRKYCFDQLDTLWDEVKRFERPHEYFVDLSEALWNVKDELLKKHK